MCYNVQSYLGGGIEAKVRYIKLWKLLIDKGMKKSPLQEAVGASKSTFAKLIKNENVTLPVWLNICEYLSCDFGDIMEAVPEKKNKITAKERVCLCIGF